MWLGRLSVTFNLSPRLPVAGATAIMLPLDIQHEGLLSGRVSPRTRVNGKVYPKSFSQKEPFDQRTERNRPLLGSTRLSIG